MARFVWPRVIRISCRKALYSIFVLFVITLVAALLRQEPLNLLENDARRKEVDSSSSTSAGGNDSSRPAVTDLPEGVAEEVQNQNGKLATRKFYAQESSFDGGERLQPLDTYPEGGSELKAARFTKASACPDVWEHPGYEDSCSYLRATPECSLGTLVEYTDVYFCVFSGAPVVAHITVILFLAALFYTAGHTADHFFCASMDKLSRFLRMSSILAGVTLLPFGNGAPDVFASIAAFASNSGQGQVGLNSVLGGAMFVSTVVSGSVGLKILSSGCRVELHRGAFQRDVFFFLSVLAVLTACLWNGKIHLSQAVCYLLMYPIYVTVVFAEEFFTRPFDCSNGSLGEPLLPDKSEDIERQDFVAPIALNIPVLQGRDELEGERLNWWSLRGFFSLFIAWPLNLPRRLTIPLIQEGGAWSKCDAVCSATLAPILLALLWDGRDGGPFGSARAEYIVAASLGVTLGGLSLIFLKMDSPPQRCRALWAAGGFIMSMVWCYIIALELVAVLVAVGVVWKIDPAIFGLTVLAWGNSVGDMISNLALAAHGDRRVQTSFSGCYAGPMFNTLIGIGVSFLLQSWKTHPAPFPIPEDTSLFITLAFLVLGLVWSMFALSPDMQLTIVFGVGQLILYAVFLFTRLAFALSVKS